MTRTYKLTSLKDAIEIATVLSKSWFRGHASVVGALIPRLFRPEHSRGHLRQLWPSLFRSSLQIEAEKIVEFRRHAPLLSVQSLPPDGDRLGWLCVMQHYRTPTRLLDWTENALVALYFVVSARPSDDGELWAMLPWALNEAAGFGWGVPLLGDPVIKYYLEQPYWVGTPESLAPSVGLAGPVHGPIALEPPMLFTRMSAQASTFTIHPPPDDPQAQTIDQLLQDDPQHLFRYLVPAAAKEQLLAGLRTLGLTDRHLFPDLEGLSRTMAFDSRIIGYGPPIPPECSGEVVDASPPKREESE